MKLYKDVCRNCINTEADVIRAIDGHNSGKYHWGYSDDKIWEKENGVACPHHNVKWYYVEGSTIPECCIHRFEHLVAAGMSHVK